MANTFMADTMTTDTMTLRQKIGQRLVAGLPSTEISPEFVALVQEHKIGNVILFRRNIDNKKQLAELCADLQALIIAETGIPAFITIDEEGGPVTRLSSDATHMPGAMALASTGRPDYAYRAGYITGIELRALGVNFNLAPVVDINSNPDNPVIGLRSYGDSVDVVKKYSLQMIRGLTDAGILSCVKHFPGHGDVTVDSHLDLPCVDKSLAALDAMELRTFKAAIDAGVPAVMSTHILFPQLEPEKIPATMSRAIMTGLLKERLGFDGLVLSDCMEMAAIKNFFGTVPGLVAAVQAGVDILFVSHTNALAAEGAQRLHSELENGAISIEEMNVSVEKILRYKRRFISQPELRKARNLLSVVGDLSVVGCAAHLRDAEKMREDTIVCVQKPPSGMPALGENPLFAGSPPFVTSLASDPAASVPNFSDFMEQRFGGKAVLTSIDPTEEEIAAIAQEARHHSCVVVCTNNGYTKKGQIALAAALAKTGAPLVVCALRSPYDLRDLPASAYALAAFEYTEASLNILARILAGTLEAKGILSLRL